MNKRRHTYQLVAVIASLLILAGAMPSGLFAQTAATDMATGKQGMVATAHPLASQAALEVLREGGNAVDAAVAAAFAIGVVEPDGSGLGGGGGMVIYMNDTKRSSYINYYHRTSGIIDRIDYRGDKDRTTAKSILVPGTVAGLTQALQQFGRLPLAQVIEPAIRLAGDGFPVDATLAQLMLDNLETIQSDSATAAIFLADGFPRMEGDTLRQPDLANTLKIIAAKGQRGFYTGPVAEGIVKRVTELGGALTIDDMANYKAELLAPVEGTYRGCQIISAAAPQSGSTIIQSLNMLENENIAAMGHFSTSAKTLHFMAETLRRSYADRWQYLGDPQFTYVPVDGIINKDYARQRVDDINLYRAEPKQYRLTQAGNPEPFDQSRTSAGGSRVQSGKTAKGWDDGLDESGTNRGGFDENMFDSWAARRVARP